MVEFGLIGKTLTHSFSKNYFEKKFKELNLENHEYHNFEIPKIEDIKTILSEHPHLRGLNVTFPYKEQVIPYLSELSPEAEATGAVNCIKIEGKEWKGFNTDVYGFSQSIKPFLDNNHQRALILGTGGAAKAVAYALKKTGVDVYFTSSSEKKNDKTFFYSEINDIVMKAFKLVVNATPLGTFPNVNTCPPLPYQLFTPEHLACDLVYNPSETLFLKQAKAAGATTMNGLSMLHLQAEKSWEIWHSN